MKKCKMAVIITIFALIILGIGSFMFVRGIEKTPVSDEQKHEGIPISNAWSSVNQKKINTINKREISKKEANTPDNPPDNIHQVSSTDNGVSNFVSTSVSISGINEQPNDEEKRKLIEEQDKHCMELMHEHGWYKPEDIPITYDKPQEPATPVGVYLWKKVKGVANPPKRPPEVEERNRELFEALKASSAKNDGMEISRIGKEIHELNNPYQPLSVKINMHLEHIPSAWSKYFFDIANAEQQKIFEEENRQQ
jgi:hypothetical protein